MTKKHKPIIPRAGEVQDIATIGSLVREGKVIYLDIETTGLEIDRDIITTVSVLEGDTCLHFTRDENLQDLVPYLEANADKVICTFNGTVFDLPFIEREAGRALAHRTIDVYLLSSERLFIPGGLKKLREGFGWINAEEQNAGADAVWLWSMWLRERDPAYRDALLEYCGEDALSLRFVLAHLFNLWAAARDIEPLPVPPVPDRPPNPLLQEVARRRASAGPQLKAGSPYAKFIDDGRASRAALIPDSHVHGLSATYTGISASVTGSEKKTYIVRLESSADGTRVHCDCQDFAKNERLPEPRRKFCKHVIKVLAISPPAQCAALFEEGRRVDFSFR
ncbi:MAG: ribonuclease H-like domain-containing protein [Candidatus Sigynarchaeota archaeon]